MRKTSFYTLPTVTKVSMACEAAAPAVGGLERDGPPFPDFFLRDLYFLLLEALLQNLQQGVNGGDGSGTSPFSCLLLSTTFPTLL